MGCERRAVWSGGEERFRRIRGWSPPLRSTRRSPASNNLHQRRWRADPESESRKGGSTRRGLRRRRRQSPPAVGIGGVGEKATQPPCESHPTQRSMTIWVYVMAIVCWVGFRARRLPGPWPRAALWSARLSPAATPTSPASPAPPISSLRSLLFPRGFQHDLG